MPPYTPETYHIIGEAELKQMKPTAVLINTGRGPLVDEKALVQALKDGTIHGAGPDVFEFGDYPSPELLEMENVVSYAPYWDADIGNAYYHGAYGLTTM